MDVLSMLRCFEVRCPNCGGDLEIAVRDTEYIEIGKARQITPYFKCTNEECGSGYLPKIELQPVLQHVVVNMTIEKGDKPC